MTTQSLPSFATFSAMRTMTDNNSLPPILTRTYSNDYSSRHSSAERSLNPKKRSRESTTHENKEDGSRSPTVRVKEEPDVDMLDSSNPPSPRHSTYEPAPPPSAVRPPLSKKRRVTVSGTGPHPLVTDIDPKDAPASAAISPVVMSIDQVRSIISVKEKQKALIEQRRGSAAGLTTVTEPEDHAKIQPIARTLRRSPNAGTSSGSRLQMQVLPPPSNSFTNRRANQLRGGIKKPADIVISPRETQQQFQPVIQSAPPVSRAGDNGPFNAGRFAMTLPRIPSVMSGSDSLRRVVASHVPPTPTRLAMLRNSSSSQVPQAAASGPSNRSPPATVPIASTRVPQTPSFLSRPDNTREKAAFLGPFEVFYDALNDSKKLKNWLEEQTVKANQLVQNLTQQQTKLDEIVDGLVEKRVGGMRTEISTLHRRVQDLEESLRLVQAGSRRQSIDSMGAPPIRNGLLPPLPSDSYTFPPLAESSRRRPAEPTSRASPSWGVHDKDHSLRAEPEHSSPVPFNPNLRRQSLSATRLEPGRDTSSASSSRLIGRSPPQAFNTHVAHHSATNNAKGSQRPAIRRQDSSSNSRTARYQSDSMTTDVKTTERGTPPRRIESRRSSVAAMSPPPQGGPTGDDT